MFYTSIPGPTIIRSAKFYLKMVLTRVGYFEGMPREEVVKWRLQEGKEGYVPSQRDRRDKTGVLEDIRFMPDPIMYDTLSEGKRNKNNILT